MYLAASGLSWRTGDLLNVVGGLPVAFIVQAQ